MYKKSYIHLTSCMINDNTDMLFKNTLRCSDELAFIRYVKSKGYTIKDTLSENGFPVSKVYNSNSHLMTFDMSQSTIFTDLPLKDITQLQ